MKKKRFFKEKNLDLISFSNKYINYLFDVLKKIDKKKLVKLEKILETLSSNNYTKLFFIPSKKINFYLKSFKKYFSGRKIIIAKEITKIHEEFFRDDIDNIKTMNSSFKGELTVIISNRNSKIKKFSEEKIVNKAKKYLKKYSLKDTVDLILETYKINKKKVYQICLDIKNEKNN